jgi:hypothetical protein
MYELDVLLYDIDFYIPVCVGVFVGVGVTVALGVTLNVVLGVVLGVGVTVALGVTLNVVLVGVGVGVALGEAALSKVTVSVYPSPSSGILVSVVLTVNTALRSKPSNTILVPETPTLLPVIMSLTCTPMVELSDPTVELKVSTVTRYKAPADVSV